jgi:hypothetical protein
MNFIRALVELFNPCIHQWDVTATLQDGDPPTAVTIVRTCAICGEIDQQRISGPPQRPVPEVCPPHKWVTQRTINLYDTAENGGLKISGQLPNAQRHEQQCARCGDLRSVVMNAKGTKVLEAGK